MLANDAHEIRLRDKIQHPEPGIVELLGLEHFPQLLAPDRPKPDGVHLCIHAVKLLRLKPRFPDNGPLLGNAVADILNNHGGLYLQEVPQHHGFHSHPHIYHLFDVIQAQKGHIGAAGGNGLRKPLLLQKTQGIPHRRPGHTEALAYIILTNHLARFKP